MSRKRIINEGAAAPSSTPASVQDSDTGQGRVRTHACEYCKVTYQTSRSLALHQRDKHPEAYHASNIPQEIKARWSDEEKVLVAREELRLVAAARRRDRSASRIYVNADLCRAFPHRSLESIKGLRKQRAYQTLRSALDERNREAPPADPLESPERVFSVADTQRKWSTPSPLDRKGPKIRWSAELLSEVARWEAMLSLVGCKKINVELSKQFPDRTLEAIKGMRRLPKYKARVVEYLQEKHLLPTLPVMDMPPPEQVSRFEDNESRGELSGDNGRTSSDPDPTNLSGDTLPVMQDMGPTNTDNDGSEVLLDEMDESLERSECRVTSNVSEEEGEMMNVAVRLDGGSKPPGRRGEGSGGVSPPIPPCNPGKQDEGRTDRDGDGTGGSFTLRRSERNIRKERRAKKGTEAGGERPERDHRTRSATTHEEEDPPPPIPPCNPGREDESWTAQDGDAVAGGGESGSWATMCEAADECEFASPPIPPCTPGHVQDGDAAVGFAGSRLRSEEGVRSPESEVASNVSWASHDSSVPEMPDPSTPMLAAPVSSEEQINRDHDSWRESLRQELILTQGYFVGWDSLEFLDFRPSQLSREHQQQIDMEYLNWIELELGT